MACSCCRQLLGCFSWIFFCELIMGIFVKKFLGGFVIIGLRGWRFDEFCDFLNYAYPWIWVRSTTDRSRKGTSPWQRKNCGFSLIARNLWYCFASHFFLAFHLFPRRVLKFGDSYVWCAIKLNSLSGIFLRLLVWGGATSRFSVIGLCFLTQGRCLSEFVLGDDGHFPSIWGECFFWIFRLESALVVILVWGFFRGFFWWEK